MSNLVFPDLPGMTIKVKRAPVWRNEIARSASGRRQAVGFSAYPDRWKFELEFEFLRSGAEAELQALVGFFNKMRGNFDTFLWLDPDDNVVTNQLLGTGDGSRTSWPLVREFGGFVEPVTDAMSASAEISALAGRVSSNVLKWSNSLENAVWVKGQMAVALGQPDAFGGSSAWALSMSGSDPFVIQAMSGLTPSVPVTAVFWARRPAGSRTFRCYMGGDSVIWQTFTATSSWQKFSMQATTSASGGLSFQFGGGGSLNSAGDFHLYLPQVSYGTAVPAGFQPTQAVPFTMSVSASSVSTSFAIDSWQSVYWSGTFLKRCTFVASELETERFLYQLYKCGKVELQTEKA